MDGSATLYVVNYTGYLSGVNCGSVVISSTMCEDKVCHHTFTAGSSTPCSASLIEGITITVFAVNIIGKGPTSNSFTIIKPHLPGKYNIIT